MLLHSSEYHKSFEKDKMRQKIYLDLFINALQLSTSFVIPSF